MRQPISEVSAERPVLIGVPKWVVFPRCYALGGCMVFCCDSYGAIVLLGIPSRLVRFLEFPPQSLYSFFYFGLLSPTIVSKSLLQT